MTLPEDLPDTFHDLAGHRALVTGAAGGIGLAVARGLTVAGAEVVAVDKNKAELLQALGDTCTCVVHDFATDDPAQLAEELLRDGPIAFIVNNVGTTTERSFLDLTAGELDKVFSVNLRNPLLLTQRLVKALIAERRGGSIVFVSSLHDRFVSGNLHYSLTKAAVSMSARELAFELGSHNIRVNAISPGWIRTARDAESEEQLRKANYLTPLIPLGRPGQPSDVARMALLLLSGRWTGYVTGENLVVDGGLALHTWRRNGTATSDTT